MNDVVDVVFIDLHGAVISDEYLRKYVNAKHYINSTDIKNVELPKHLYPNSGTFFSYGVEGGLWCGYSPQIADSAFGYSTLDKIFDTSITRDNCAIKEVEKKDGLYYALKMEHAKEFTVIHLCGPLIL